MPGMILRSLLCAPLLSLSAATPITEDSNALTRQGIMSIRAGQRDEGIKLLDQAIQKDSDNSLAYYWRGRAKADQGRYKDAIADFDKVIHLDPGEPTAYVARADARRKLEDEAGMKKDMVMATKLEPDYAKPPAEIKNAQPGGRDKKLSLTDRLSKMIELSEDQLKAEKHVQMGVALINQGKMKEAQSQANQAIRLNPELAEAYYLLATTKVAPQEVNAMAVDGPGKNDASGGLKAAIADFDKAIELSPDFPAAFHARGYTKHVLGMLDEAVQDYTEAIRLNPSFADAYSQRGLARTGLKQYRKALTDLNQAIDLNPRHPEAHVNRGTTKFYLADYKGAIDDWKKAITLKPALRNVLQKPISDAQKKMR